MNNLKEARKKKGITQQEVADFLNVTKMTYSRYEREVHKMDQDTLKKLSSFFDLSIDYLVGNTNVPLTLDQVRFDTEVDKMSDEEILDKYDLTLAGEPLTKEEAKKMLELIRALNK